MPAIDTRALTRSYGHRRGIEAVNLSVPEGSLFGFLGPNGAGKTTTIRLLLGFLRPTSGRASVFGLDCWSATARIKADVGYIPGDLRLYPWLNTLEALRIFGAVRGRDMSASGKTLAEQFGLDPHVRVRVMSKGTRQKLGLVLALAHRPKLLVLDEPTSGLDPLVQAQLRAELRRMAEAGHTIFFSSHTLSEVDDLCDRVAIVKDGRIVADEPLESLRAKAGHQVSITWATDAAAAASPPPFLHVDRDGRTWTGTLDGDVARLISYLNGLPMADLTIGRPDLETLFQSFYERGEQ
jgi:ABC-2 type transport system ATP-binding protein